MEVNKLLSNKKKKNKHIMANYILTCKKITPYVVMRFIYVSII